MAKPRQPLSVEEATYTIIAVLGMETVCAAVGKSATLLRNWADPDNDTHHMPFAAAIALDAAFVRAGHGPAPLLLVHQAAVAAAADQARHTATPEARLMDLTQRLGDVVGEVRAAVTLDGDGGRRITDRDMVDVLAAVEQMRDSLNALTADIAAMNASDKNVTPFMARM